MKHDAAPGHSRIRIEPGTMVHAVHCGHGGEHVLASVAVGNRGRGQVPLDQLGPFLAELTPSPTHPTIIGIDNRGASSVAIDII